MTISLKDFVKNNLGTRKSYITKNGYQCVDVAKFYIEAVLRGAHYGSIGHAKDYFYSLPETDFIKIAANSGEKPRRGDIIVWGASFGGGYGHIAVVLAYDDTGFWALEQNGVGNHNGIGDDAIRIKKYTRYSGVIGWCRYKNIASIVAKSEFDQIVHNKGLYLWEATNYLKRKDVAEKVFYYLAGYTHYLHGKNASHIWNGQYGQSGIKRQELANMIVNFYTRVLGKNISYQTLIEKGIWNGSRPEDTATGEEFTLMIHRSKNAL